MCWRSWRGLAACKQWVELAVALECMQFVAAADMHCPDEYLRHSHAPFRPSNHLVPALPVTADIDLAINHAFPFQQGLGRRAIGAIAGRVDYNGCHSVVCAWKALLYGGARRRHNPCKYQHINMGGACPQQGTGARINRCTGREDVV